VHKKDECIKKMIARTNTEAQEKQQCPSLQDLGVQLQASPALAADVCDVPAPLQRELGIAGPAGVSSDLVLTSPTHRAITGLSLRCKQGIDFVLSCVLLLIALPIMVVIWIAIRCDSKGPGIIVQDRIGYQGRPFRFYKFRTMYSDCGDHAHRSYVKDWMHNRPAKNTAVFKIVADQRVTRVGAILRRYSLDELPQLFNVLKFEMSLVGPRPALPYEVDNYAAWHKERFGAPPGLTGLWQVSGRNLLSFEDMVRLDIEYLQIWSIGLDFKLLAKTISVVLRGTGH
jgi:lipopolysaccharide/colanic/teichoic acid biosynthesis glycosyltransferase